MSNSGVARLRNAARAKAMRTKTALPKPAPVLRVKPIDEEKQTRADRKTMEDEK